MKKCFFLGFSLEIIELIYYGKNKNLFNDQKGNINFNPQLNYYRSSGYYTAG
jgi:hypothetical protein